MPSDGREASEGSTGGAHARYPPEEQGGGVERDTREASAERYFSVRWMRERERAVEASDDCSSAFAIIPVCEFLEFLLPTRLVVAQPRRLEVSRVRLPQGRQSESFFSYFFLVFPLLLCVCWTRGPCPVSSRT